MSLVQPFILRIAVAVAINAMSIIAVAPGYAQVPGKADPGEADPLRNGPLIWDANHDGIYTCDEWKKFADQIFRSADRNHDGFLDASEFAIVRKTDPSLADAELGYFDDNGDGKVSRKEFVEKPSPFIMRNDRNGDCRVTPEELKGVAPKENPGAKGKRGGGGMGGGMGGGSRF